MTGRRTIADMQEAIRRMKREQDVCLLAHSYEAREIVEDAMQNCLSHRVTDWSKMKNAIRDSLGEFLWKRTKRRPMILPIIMEVE